MGELLLLDRYESGINGIYGTYYHLLMLLCHGYLDEVKQCVALGNCTPVVIFLMSEQKMFYRFVFLIFRKEKISSEFT